MYVYILLKEFRNKIHLNREPRLIETISIGMEHKDKEAVFNVAFETDNISSVELLLRHNKYRIPICFLVSSWHYPFVASVSKGATSTI